METFLAVDLPNWLQDNFRARTNPRSWTTFGFSEGGYCAAMLAMRHPDRYAAAVDFAGYSAPEFDGNYKPFAPGSVDFDAYNLVNMAKNAPPAVSLRIQTSKQDALSWKPTKALLDAAKAPMSVTAAIIPGVGHRLPVWVADMPNGLRWLGTSIDGFKVGVNTD